LGGDWRQRGAGGSFDLDPGAEDAEPLGPLRPARDRRPCSEHRIDGPHREAGDGAHLALAPTFVTIGPGTSA